MKRLASLTLAVAVILCGCTTSKRSPDKQADPPSASDTKCLCDYHANEPCPDSLVEMDMGTPGCTIPPEALPQHPRDVVFEDPSIERLFARCDASAYALPSKCPNPSTKVIIHANHVVCKWECGRGKSPQPQHGPWTLMQANVDRD